MVMITRRDFLSEGNAGFALPTLGSGAFRAAATGSIPMPSDGAPSPVNGSANSSVWPGAAGAPTFEIDFVDPDTRTFAFLSRCVRLSQLLNRRNAE
jgi:hypothetical protein